MKKTGFVAFILLVMFTALPHAIVSAQQVNSPFVIELVKPDQSREFTLMQALNERKTNREMTDEELTNKQLSELLWSANGMNRPDGKRTAPSTQNRQMTDIYVVMETGIFYYNPALHNLTRTVTGDHRSVTGTQPFVETAPVNLLFVSSLAKLNGNSPAENCDLFMWAGVEAGAMAQNVYLYGAAENLAVVIRGSVDREALAKVMNLSEDQIIVVAQTVGVPIKVTK